MPLFCFFRCRTASRSPIGPCQCDRPCWWGTSRWRAPTSRWCSRGSLSPFESQWITSASTSSVCQLTSCMNFSLKQKYSLLPLLRCQNACVVRLFFSFSNCLFRILNWLHAEVIRLLVAILIYHSYHERTVGTDVTLPLYSSGPRPMTISLQFLSTHFFSTAGPNWLVKQASSGPWAPGLANESSML